MARVTYEPITEITDELLAMRWRTDASARMYFSRRASAPGRLGLKIIEDDGEFRVEPKSGRASIKPAQAGAPADYEAWALEVDQLLIDANEPPETEATLEALFAQMLTAANAAQRIITRRAADLEIATAPAKAVVADTLADQAAAVHADSEPVIVRELPPKDEVLLNLVTTGDMAAIVARRLSDIAGVSVVYADTASDTGGYKRVDPRETESPRR